MHLDFDSKPEIASWFDDSFSCEASWAAQKNEIAPSQGQDIRFITYWRNEDKNENRVWYDVFKTLFIINQ